MRELRLLLISLVAGLSLVAAGCGSSGSSGAHADRDGDGIPNTEDAFPDDATRFAAFDQVDLTSLQAGAFTAAVAISDNPTIVGNADDGSGILKAVRWGLDGAAPTAPVTLNPLTGNTYSAAFGVDSTARIIVGESAKGAGIFVPVYWAIDGNSPVELRLSQTEMVDDAPVVTVLGTSGAAYGINAHGQIVGEIRRDDGTFMAVIWNDVDSDPMELPNLGGESASAYYINDGGWVVGESNAAAGEQMQATLWTVAADGSVVGDEAIPLGMLAGHAKSIALGVDGEGRIVGESEESDGTVHAVLWTPATGAEYAISSLGVNAGAQAINDAGRIAGHGGSPAVAAVWDTRLADPTAFDAVLDGPGVSRGYGQNQTGHIVGIQGNTAFVAIPQ